MSNSKKESLLVESSKTLNTTVGAAKGEGKRDTASRSGKRKPERRLQRVTS